MPGFLATVWVSPDDDLGTVVMGNVTAGFTAGALAADLLHAVAELMSELGAWLQRSQCRRRGSRPGQRQEEKA